MKYIIFSASAETDFMRKQYTKVLDAYGCLGILSLSAGGKLMFFLLILLPQNLVKKKKCDLDN